LPLDCGAEVAFAGRSNAGKSTLLNRVCGQRALARTSKTPGRTQHMVCYSLDEDKRLIDLPGWGYAEVPKSLLAHWQSTLPNYLRSRRSLVGLVLVVDARRGLQEEEREFVDWAQAAGIAVEIALNKADKLNQRQRSNLLAEMRTLTTHSQLGFGLVSALKGTGIELLRERIESWLSSRDG
jgi:GTP-binding protein